jgi:hypothetical protein
MALPPGKTASTDFLSQIKTPGEILLPRAVSCHYLKRTMASQPFRVPLPTCTGKCKRRLGHYSEKETNTPHGQQGLAEFALAATWATLPAYSF